MGQDEIIYELSLPHCQLAGEMISTGSLIGTISESTTGAGSEMPDTNMTQKN